MPTTKANLNLRTGAGTDHSIILTIPANAQVSVGAVTLGDTVWAPVTYNGKQGWVSAKYLDSGDVPGDTQTPYDDYVADALALAKRMLGLWYRWGGNFTQEPFDAKRGDCSGYVGWVSETMGYRPGSNALYNYTADSMFDNFRTGVWAAEKIEPGQEQPMDLVFYGGSSTYASHVVFALGDGTVIGASGGGSSVVSDAIAKSKNAKVRIDDLHYRKDLIGIYRPDYGAGR